MYLTRSEKKKVVAWSIVGGVGGILLLGGAFIGGFFLGKNAPTLGQEKYTLYCTTDKDGKTEKLQFDKEENNTLETPVREGRVFLGYYNSGDVMYFDADGNQTEGLLLENGLHLTAKWQYLEYTLTFDVGNDPLFSLEMSEQTAYYGETLKSFPVPTVNDPAYTFVGWFNEDETVRYSDNKGKPVKAEYSAENYPIAEYATKLYAVLARKICTVTLDYNDNAQTPSVTLEVPYGENIPELSDYLKDDGTKEIVEWSLSRYTGMELPVTAEKDYTFYAVWQEYKNVGLSYGKEDVRNGKIYEEADGYCTLPVPEKAGYSFVGWYLDDGLLDSVGYVKFDELASTYYAKWTPTDYTLTFQTDSGQEFEKIIYTYGTQKTLPSPSKTGYAFKGWLRTNGGVEIDGVQPVYEITADLYGDYLMIATWENSKYAVALDSNGGQISSVNAIVAYQTEYTLSVPSKTGYTFLGWFDSNDETAVQYTDGNGESKAAWAHAENGKKLYAKWRINTYTVRYETGDDASGVETQTYEHGATLAFGEKPVHAEGKLFNGWYNQAMTEEYTQKTVVLSDMVVYANWLDSKPISTADDLMTIWENPSANYHLTNDINLNGQQWACIETFSGIFNGNGYKIYNFILSHTGSATVNFGFIGKNTGTVKNITFEDVSLSLIHSGNCSGYAGIVAGYNTGKIIACKVGVNTTAQCTETRSTDTTGTAYVGGLVGYSTGEISACVSEVDFVSCQVKATGGNYRWDAGYATMVLGGVVGYVSGGTLSECTYSGEMTASNVYVNGFDSEVKCYMGGVAGWIATGSMVENCGATVIAEATGSTGSQHAGYTTRIAVIGGFVGVNDGTISVCFAESSINGKSSGEGYVGGFVGWNRGEIVNCYATATAKNTGYYTGGFAAYNAGSVNGSYATGAVTSSGTYVGGFVGWNASGAVIMRSFSAGNVAGTSTTVTWTDVFVPSAGNNGTIQRCHYADNVTVTRGGTLVTLYEAVTGLTKKTTQELQSADFLYNTLYWDNAVWKTAENAFPKLYWQN